MVNERRADFGSRGFTLLELLVAVALIGILSAIAITQYSAYRQRGFDTAAHADLRNAAVAEEALVAAGGAYTSCRNATCDQRLPGFRRSRNVTLRLRRAGSAFTGTSSHPSGSGKVWSYDSADGRTQ